MRLGTLVWLGAAGVGLCMSCGSGDDSSSFNNSGGSAGMAGSAGSGGTGGGTGGSAGAATGGSAGAATGGSAGASGGSAGSGGAAGAGGDAGLTCNGTHPILDAGDRRCNMGQCRCRDSDLCFPRDAVAACCQGGFDCFTADGGTQQCMGTHPLLDAGARFCGMGDCYCSTNDTCYPAGSADVCCSAMPKCN